MLGEKKEEKNKPERIPQAESSQSSPTLTRCCKISLVHAKSFKCIKLGGTRESAALASLVKPTNSFRILSNDGNGKDRLVEESIILQMIQLNKILFVL